MGQHDATARWRSSCCGKESCFLLSFALFQLGMEEAGRSWARAYACKVWEWWSDEDEWEPFQEVDAQVLEKAMEKCVQCTT